MSSNSKDFRSRSEDPRAAKWLAIMKKYARMDLSEDTSLPFQSVPSVFKYTQIQKRIKRGKWRSLRATKSFTNGVRRRGMRMAKRRVSHNVEVEQALAENEQSKAKLPKQKGVTNMSDTDDEELSDAENEPSTSKFVKRTGLRENNRIECDTILSCDDEDPIGKVVDRTVLTNTNKDVCYNENATSSEAILTTETAHIRQALGEFAGCQYVDPERYILSKLKTERNTSNNSNCLFDVSLDNGSKRSIFLTQVELPKDIPEIRKKIEKNSDFYLKYWLASQAKLVGADNDDYLYFVRVSEEEIQNMPETISTDDVQKYMAYCLTMFFKVADFIP